MLNTAFKRSQLEFYKQPHRYRDFSSICYKEGLCVELSYSYPSQLEALSNQTKPSNWLQRSREQCKRIAKDEGILIINFAQWLFLSDLKLLLTFKNQKCVSVTNLKSQN